MIRLNSASVLFIAALSAAAQPPPASTAAQLEAFYAAEWEYQLQHSPEFATYVGDARFNDRLGDYSIEEAARSFQHAEERLKALQAIPGAGLTEQQTISRDIMMRQLTSSIDSYRLKEWENSLTVPQTDFSPERTRQCLALPRLLSPAGSAAASCGPAFQAASQR
jgi:uncharacterized protein (DUF885 family)